MSTPLAQRCLGDATLRLTTGESEVLLQQLPGWALVEREGVLQLERQYAFKDFAEALAFTNQVGALAEAEDHHPALLTTWGQVTVTWWSHSLGGLHDNDFIMAARTEALVVGAEQ